MTLDTIPEKDVIPEDLPLTDRTVRTAMSKVSDDLYGWVRSLRADLDALTAIVQPESKEDPVAVQGIHDLQRELKEGLAKLNPPVDKYDAMATYAAQVEALSAENQRLQSWCRQIADKLGVEL